MAFRGTLHAALKHLAGQLDLDWPQDETQTQFRDGDRDACYLLLGIALISLISEIRTILRDRLPTDPPWDVLDLDNPPK